MGEIYFGTHDSITKLCNKILVFVNNNYNNNYVFETDLFITFIGLVTPRSVVDLP